MNFHEMRKEFDRMTRTAGLSDFEDYRDSWINQAWRRITELFVIPSLIKTVHLDSVADQNQYLLPYDYNGTELGILHDGDRLDPVDEETLLLAYENRTGSKGKVRYYTISGTAESDLLLVNDCTISNGSKEVLTSSANPVLNQAHWLRFDPKVGEEDDDMDEEGYVDPKDYGYLINAGAQVEGASFQLTFPYRGPGASGMTAKIQPAEQPQFKTYGTPTTSVSEAFTITYAAKPRRMYNPADVPEWPNMGDPIALMAISMALDWHHHTELSQTFFGRAVTRVQGLQRREKRHKILTPEVTIGRVSGRKTGMRAVYMGRRR